MSAADLGAFNQGLGGAVGASQVYGDPKKTGEAAIELVNSLGGIAGRSVEPVWYQYEPSSILTASGRQRESQRACARWTEDEPVFALNPLFPDPTIYECAARTKTLVIDTDPGYPSQRQLEEGLGDYWYGPQWWVSDRRERAGGLFLLRHGFFNSDAKVAIMMGSWAGVRDGVERGLKPVLAAAGIRPEVEIVYPDPIESPWSTYALQLQMAGVTHVVWAGTTAAHIAALLMMRAAEDQQYRPNWGLGSDHYPDQLANTYNAPPAQLENVSAMGWLPIVDTGDQAHQSDNSTRCAERLRKHGVDEPHGRDVYKACEALMFLRAGFERAGVVSPAGFSAGVARLADSYRSMITIGGATRFGPGRHDAVAVVRRVAYDRTATRFEYTTRPEPVPE